MKKKKEYKREFEMYENDRGSNEESVKVAKACSQATGKDGMEARERERWRSADDGHLVLLLYIGLWTDYSLRLIPKA